MKTAKDSWKFTSPLSCFEDLLSVYHKSDIIYINNDLLLCDYIIKIIDNILYIYIQNKYWYHCSLCPPLGFSFIKNWSHFHSLVIHMGGFRPDRAQKSFGWSLARIENSLVRVRRTKIKFNSDEK